MEEAWRTNMGLNFILRPKEDVLEKSISMDGRSVSTAAMAELDDMLTTLSNYYLFLQSSVGEVAAKIHYINEVLDRKCSEAASKVQGGHYFERKALVLARDEKLNNMNDKLTEYRAKLEILKPIADGVKMKLETMRRIYDRRARER
jgi:hypothetical protein